MKKDKFLAEIHGRGEHNDAIIQMITNNNEGKIQLTFEIIRGYIIAKYCQYPSIMPDVETIGGAKTFDIIEKGKPTLSLRIIEIEVPEPATNELQTT